MVRFGRTCDPRGEVPVDCGKPTCSTTWSFEPLRLEICVSDPYLTPDHVECDRGCVVGAVTIRDAGPRRNFVTRIDEPFVVAARAISTTRWLARCRMFAWCTSERD